MPVHQDKSQDKQNKISNITFAISDVLQMVHSNIKKTPQK